MRILGRTLRKQFSFTKEHIFKKKMILVEQFPIFWDRSVITIQECITPWFLWVLICRNSSWICNYISYSGKLRFKRYANGEIIFKIKPEMHIEIYLYYIVNTEISTIETQRKLMFPKYRMSHTNISKVWLWHFKWYIGK